MGINLSRVERRALLEYRVLHTRHSAFHLGCLLSTATTSGKLSEVFKFPFPVLLSY
jgi:hypothetical protein